MKSIIAFIALATCFSVSASSSFTCEIIKKVVSSRSCLACVQYNGDNDCIREVQTTCLEEKSVKIGLKDSIAKIPSGDLFLGNREAGTSYFFSRGENGYSARVTSLEHNTEASFGANSYFNPAHDSLELIAKTNERKDKIGSVTAVVLNCKSH